MTQLCKIKLEPYDMYNLKNIVEQAIHECVRTDDEEDGGVILIRNGDYKWVKLKNSISGESRAKVLYVIDKYGEYVDKVISQFQHGWRLFASFHVHPQFTSQCSHIDETMLFRDFNKNIIYSGLTSETRLYQWEGGQLTYECIERI